ncbi:MAG: hypothetical protein ACKN9V_10300 [Pseudomonadota bacterium]
MRDFLDWLRTAPTEKRQKAILLLSLGLVISLVALIAVILILKAQGPSQVVAPSAAPHEIHSKGPYSFPYEINEVSMAVMNKKGTKTAYAQFSLVLDCPSEEAHKTLSMNRAKLLDAIFVVGGNFYLDDFQGEKAPKSFEKFKKDLLEKYKSDFHAEAPREIALKDWVVN